MFLSTEGRSGFCQKRSFISSHNQVRIKEFLCYQTFWDSAVFLADFLCCSYQTKILLVMLVTLKHASTRLKQSAVLIISSIVKHGGIILILDILLSYLFKVLNRYEKLESRWSRI